MPDARMLCNKEGGISFDVKSRYIEGGGLNNDFSVISFSNEPIPKYMKMRE